MTAGTRPEGACSRVRAVAPNGSEPPFVRAQSMVLLALAVLTLLAVKKFRSAGVAAA